MPSESKESEKYLFNAKKYVAIEADLEALAENSRLHLVHLLVVT